MYEASRNSCHCHRLRSIAEQCTCDLKDLYNDRWSYRGHQLNQSLRSFPNHCHGCVQQPSYYVHPDGNETARDLSDIQYSQNQYYPSAVDHSRGRISPRSPPFVTTLPRSSTPTNGCWDKLSLSIWQRFTAIKQTEKTFLQKMNLWGHLYECVQKIPRLPKFELFLMGSTISGFGMEGSDIDMCVVAKDGPLYCDLRTEALENLLHVKQFLDRMPSSNLEQISLICAMVPILRLKHKSDDFDIEISFNNYVGIRNTQLLHCYAQLDWRVRPLVIIVKLWAKHNNLNDPKNCTLSSYSLALMVINFLQCGVSPPVLPCLHELYPEKFSGPVNTDRLKLFERVEAFSTDNDDTLSSLFINFLKYYTKFE
ncbi:AGAP001130-PA-like protein [Anopheles sinensis]|uniref:AGAP001130-PA-like protein n=1 Tax=Anopheles sinensis TaxID=74873 RepID=A0A084W9H9_ANOSI|nr:AGAP001130-PA-like protein [Anopheles sinensis]